MFEILTADLLSKCFHGDTQNNESFHNKIWSFCPTGIFVGRRLELAVNSAVIQFNGSDDASASVCDYLGMPISKQLSKYSDRRNHQHVARSRRASTAAAKH
jgi:hypothetical protein